MRAGLAATSILFQQALAHVGATAIFTYEVRTRRNQRMSREYKESGGMAVQVEIVVDHVFEVSADRETVFALLSDVPRSVSHFPDVVELIDQGDEVYEWVMKSKGPRGFGHAVRYACHYTSNPAARTVTWSPIQGVGNAVFSGTWKLEVMDAGTRVHFGTNAILSVPAPRMLRSAVAPYADKALRGEIKEYLENLQVTLNS